MASFLTLIIEVFFPSDVVGLVMVIPTSFTVGLQPICTPLILVEVIDGGEFSITLGTYLGAHVSNSKILIESMDAK